MKKKYLWEQKDILTYARKFPSNQLALPVRRLGLRPISGLGGAGSYLVQKMTEAQHNGPIQKFLGNQPSALTAEVFGETIGPAYPIFHFLLFAFQFHLCSALKSIAYYRKVASSNTSRLKAHAGFFKLLMEGIFDTCVLWPFDIKLIS